MGTCLIPAADDAEEGQLDENCKGLNWRSFFGSKTTISIWDG